MGKEAWSGFLEAVISEPHLQSSCKSSVKPRVLADEETKIQQSPLGLVLAPRRKPGLASSGL